MIILKLYKFLNKLNLKKRIRKMLDLTPYQPQFISNESDMSTHKPVCVILHLYYQDLWEWFIPYLKNITYDFDLYVSTNVDSVETDLELRVKALYPNAYFYNFENKGLDVAPFLFVVNDILINSNRTYDAIIKLHGKKSIAHGEDLGNRWRFELTESLLSSFHKFESCFNAVTKHPLYKMAGSMSWSIVENVKGYESNFFNDMEIPFNNYEFIGGTMFMINFDVIEDWMTKGDSFNKFYNLFPEGYVGDGSLAHQLERVFGCMIKLYGYQIFKS